VNEAWRARERLRQEKDEPTQSARDLRELLGKTVEIPGKPVDEEELAQKGITIFEISREERNQFLSRYNSFWTVHQLEELSEKLKKNATTILTQDDFKDILSRAEQKAFEENLRYLVDYLHKVIQGKPVSTEHPYEGILEGPSQLSNPLAILLHQLKDSDLNITASYAVLERFIQELDQNITKLEESLPPETEDAFHYSVSHFVLEIKEAFARRAEVRLPAGKAETERGGDKKFNEQGLFRDGPYGFEPQDTKGSQKSAPSLRTKSRWDPSFRILSPVGNLQDKPNQPTIKDKTKNKGRQTKSPWSEEPSKNERPQNYGSRIRSHFLEGSQLTLAQILHGGSRVSKIYGYVNSLFTKRYNRFPVFRRAEVRRKEGFGEQINAGGVFAAGDSRLEGWHPSARLLRKPPQKTSRFLMTSPVSFLSLEQIGHKNQQRGTDSSHQKNTSTEGLGLQGEGYDQARENRRIGIQAELHQILSAFWRNLQKRFHSWVSSSSAQGRKSQAIERKSASRRIRRTFWNGVPYQRTSLTKDPLNRNELTITSVLRNRPPHSNLFTRDPHSFTLGTSVQNPIRIFKISQEENHNKLKFRNPPQANSRRAEVRAEKKRGKDNEASERVFFDRVGQSKGVWLSLRRSPQEYKLTSGAFQETRSSFSPLAGTNQPPKISTKKEAPASASFISRLASFTKKSVEMAAGARSENRLRKAFPSSEHRLVPRRSFIDVGYFDKSVTYNSEYVNNYFPDIPSWNLRYGSPRAEVRKEKLEVGSSKLEVEENEEGNLIQLFLPGQRGDRAISASELLRQAEVRREALARRLGRSLDQAVMAPLREKSDGEEIIEALDRLTKDSLRRRLGFWAGWVNVPGLLERVRGAALGRIVPEVYAGAPIVADPAELNQAKQLVWGALSSLDRKTVIEFRIPDLGKVPNRGSLLEELAETVFSAAVLNPELYISILVDSKREEEILNRSLNRRWNKEALAFVKQERIRVIPATNRVLAGLDGPPQMVISPYPQEALTQQKAELAFDAARDANQNLLPYSGPEQVRLGALFLAALTALSQKTVEGLIRRDSLIQAEGPHAFHPFELLLQARLLEGAAHDTMSRAA